jgi:hypothetical protein
MSQTFQFTLKRLLGAMILIGISMQLLRWASATEAPLAGILGSAAFLGATWGLLRGQTVAGFLMLGAIMAMACYFQN